MLFLRFLSALIGIPVVVLAVYQGGYWFGSFLLLVANLAAWEYNDILKAREIKGFPLLVNLGISLFLVTVFLEQPLLIFPLIMILFTLLSIGTLSGSRQISINGAAVSLWGIIYLGGLFSYLLMLRLQPEGMLQTFTLLAGVWLHDSAAYFVGVKWGVHKFAPEISPGKTLEGSLAGVFCTVALFFSAAILFPGLLTLSPLVAVVLALGIAVFSQLGDLLESRLKRDMQVKDAGKIIPGHGGVLDRFDSLLMAAPFTYYFYILVNLLN